VVTVSGCCRPNTLSSVEFLPLQPTEQQLDLSPNPGDNMFVQVFNGNAKGQPKVNGAYFWYEVDDITQGQYVYTNIPYSACDPELLLCHRRYYGMGCGAARIGS